MDMAMASAIMATRSTRQDTHKSAESKETFVKLSQKLPAAFAAVLLLMVCAALFGIYSLNQSIAVYDTQVAGNVQDERTIADIESEFKTQVQEWKNVLLRGTKPELLNKHWLAFTTIESHINEEAAKLVSSLPDGESKKLVN